MAARLTVPVDALLPGVDFITCEKYRCRMPATVCLARQRAASCAGGRSPFNRCTARPHDPGCLDCAQGRQVAETAKRYERKGVNMSGPSVEKEAKVEVNPATVKMRTCRNPECEHGPTPRPLYDAEKKKWNFYGYEKLCGDCKQKAEKRRKAERRAAGEGGRMKDASVHPLRPAVAGKTVTGNPAGMVLDFTGREDLLERIEKIAADEFRSPADQVMYWIATSLTQGK